MANLTGLLTNMFKTREANNSFLAILWTFTIEKAKNEADLKRHGDGVIIGRFGRKGALIYFRGNSLEIDINDLRPTI